MMNVIPLVFLLLGAPPAFSWSLGEGREVQSPDGRREIVRPDYFTKLVVRTDQTGEKIFHPFPRSDDMPSLDGKRENPYAEYRRYEQGVIRKALDKMESMHCAIRAVAGVIERGEVKKVRFGYTVDDNGEYDSATKTITINTRKDYLYDPTNLAKGFYHEGLHHVEFALGLRRRGEGMHYHDSKRIPVILSKLLGERNPCLKLVGKGGWLLNEDGSYYEPDYWEASGEKPPKSRHSLDKIKAAALGVETADFDHNGK
ncbi:MAG: hypothetical protein HY552_02910 [Elusimicrobia bacterium]|nr:hypothetical protein [Elusimicrobiota bacterium]